MMLGTRKHEHASLKLRKPIGLPEHMRGDVVELTALRTVPEHRRNGDARTLLLKTCIEADTAGKVLFIHVKPDADSPVDTKGLFNFYADAGFLPIQAEPELLMARPPFVRKMPHALQ